MRGACRPERRGVGAAGSEGYSLIEVLLGLALALCLALAVAPIWVSLESLAAVEGDNAVWVAQGRVAVARLEQDVRLSTASGCAFQVDGLVLQATPSQLVLLRLSDSGVSTIVEWELIGGTLMRRWGFCPALMPEVFPHALYRDSKTMLEDVDTTSSRFSFVCLGQECDAMPATTLCQLDTVFIHLVGRADRGPGRPEMVASTEVGR